MIRCIICLSLLFSSWLCAHPRIMQLLPSFQDTLAVDPALPGCFEAFPLNGEKLNLFQGIIWARKADAPDILRQKDKSSHAFFVVSLSPNVAQTGPLEFSGENTFKAELEKSGFRDIETEKVMWGAYPVLTIVATNKKTERKSFAAWIGLNSEPVAGVPYDGRVLALNFFYPDDEKEPNAPELALWTDLIQETRPLTERQALEAHGYDMQDDFTLFTKEHIKIEVLAQKKLSTGELVVLVVPLSPHTEFTIKDVKEAPLALEWKHGRPAVKVIGEAIYAEGHDTEVISASINALIKGVDEFTPDFLQFKEREGTQIYKS